MDHEVNYPVAFEPDFSRPPQRQPNLGYAAALLGIGVLAAIVLSVGLAVVSHFMHLPLQKAMGGAGMAKSSIVIEGLIFAITLAVSYFVFPRFWQRPFGQVIQWNAATARRHATYLAATGVIVSICAQLLESRLTLPSQMPVDKFFKHPSDVWVIAIFGTLLAPMFEEIFFRGFLLPGFAIFFDWMSTSRTDAGRAWWLTTEGITQRSLVLSGVLTSGMFAAMHAAQLGFAWNAVGLLWLVGGMLTYVRIRYNSVAASSLVHAVYNGWIFVILFFATSGFRHLEKLSNH